MPIDGTQSFVAKEGPRPPREAPDGETFARKVRSTLALATDQESVRCVISESVQGRIQRCNIAEIAIK